MNRRRRVYEGKAKILYEGPEPGTLIQFFKDDATAFNKKKHEVIDGKGVLNNRISEYVFTHLNKIGIFPSHILPCVLQLRRFPETLSQHQLNKTVLLARFLSSRKETLFTCQRHCNMPTTTNGAPSTLRGMVGKPLSRHFSDHHIHPRLSE